MKKILERLTVFLIGVPLIVGSIYLFPHNHFLVFHVELFIVLIIAVSEMQKIVSQKLKTYPPLISIILGLIIPILSYLFTWKLVPGPLLLFIVFSVFITILLIEFFISFSGDFSFSIERISTAFFLALYPSSFSIFFSLIARWNNAKIVLCLFLLLIFACDSLAWVFGMGLGKNNRGFIPASPKKSIAGFVGGILSSVLVGILAYTVFKHKLQISFIGIITTSFLTAIAAIIGDLIESIIKRSANVKDSGKAILGRGGIMDSIDSITLGVPVFYFSFLLFMR
ncbi:CDP-archaeol synthase [Treponema phagedenis]|uniref:CDP-archaeol synthase n=1 Tax=Treponema phagedenis TaxID=162 RepID=UPI00197CBEEF|nr:CDP-archaeol synthase [Treponema phagedenis]QSH94219.1 phosphatidate cytidylyltransferase [Treponema phagedenis]